MCQFKSALCLKDRVFVPDYDSHDKMLEELRIPDDTRHASTTFVRVEVVPPDGDKFSDPTGWEVRVDQDILPEWFIPEIDHPRIKQAVAEWCAAHVLPEDVHTVKGGKWIVGGSATVKACGSATVEACDSATVKACGSATVKACGSATVILPLPLQTDKPVELNGSAICVNHRDHTIRSAIRWEQIK